jgi:hypothetical protein
MEATCSSETSVNFYETTLWNIQQDNNFQRSVNFRAQFPKHPIVRLLFGEVCAVLVLSAEQLKRNHVYIALLIISTENLFGFVFSILLISALLWGDPKLCLISFFFKQTGYVMDDGSIRAAIQG